MTDNKNKIEVADDNVVLLTPNKKLEQCETDLELAKKSIKAQNANKKEIAKQLKLAQKEIAKASKIQKIYERGLREMMFIISHKIRQPIAKIMGLSLLLEDGIENPEDVHQIVTYMKESSKLLDVFTRELTAFVHQQENIEKE
ncbi:MAG: hypothetical protein WCJ62_07995 [Flavobacterium sp.]